MRTQKDGDKLKVDIHGLYVRDAMALLERIIENCGADVKEITVIHGYNSGQALKNMVRNDLQSPRIKQIRAAYNAGETIISLRKKK